MLTFSPKQSYCLLATAVSGLSCSCDKCQITREKRLNLHPFLQKSFNVYCRRLCHHYTPGFMNFRYIIYYNVSFFFLFSAADVSLRTQLSRNKSLVRRNSTKRTPACTAPEETRLYKTRAACSHSFSGLVD